MRPERARVRILELAATQLENGEAFHQCQLPDKKGNEAIGGEFNDDPPWLVLSTAAYIRGTGPWKSLIERVPFQDQPSTEVPFTSTFAEAFSTFWTGWGRLVYPSSGGLERLSQPEHLLR